MEQRCQPALRLAPRVPRGNHGRVIHAQDVVSARSIFRYPSIGMGWVSQLGSRRCRRPISRPEVRQLRRGASCFTWNARRWRESCYLGFSSFRDLRRPRGNFGGSTDGSRRNDHQATPDVAAPTSGRQLRTRGTVSRGTGLIPGIR